MKLSTALPWLWGLGLSLLALAPMLAEWDRSGQQDWQQFHHWWEVGRIAFLRHGEFPWFDPYHCGGVPMWGQPQMQYLAPTWWVTGLAFGTLRGRVLFVLLHHVVGFAGMFTLARRVVRVRTPAAGMAALVWAFSGYFAWRSAGGHATFLGFHYLPWVFLCWRKTDHDIRYAGGVAGLLGLQLLEGGTYSFPLTFLVLAFDFLVRVPSARWRLVRTAALTGALSALCGSIRLWPIYQTMRRLPRETRLEDSQTLAEVLTALTLRAPREAHAEHTWAWAEYSSFVGWTVLVVGAAGAVIALRRRRHWHLPLGLALFTALAMGNVSPRWPWPQLHALPPFDSLHVPSRFHVVATFYLSLLAALALERGLRWTTRVAAERRTQRVMVLMAWLLVATVGVDVISNTRQVLTTPPGPAIRGDAAESFHLVAPSPYLPLYMHYPRRNIGTAACYDPVPWPISDALWVGPAPQARLEPATAGTVDSSRRTNHTVTAHVTLEAPARVVFNQNYDPDWRVSVGTLASDRGRLAVDLPAGAHEVVADYRPPDLPWSLLTCFFGVLGSALLLRFAPARPREERQAGPSTLTDDAGASIRLARQRARASERLLAEGHVALALELAADAFRHTAAAAPPTDMAHRSAERRRLEAELEPPLPELDRDTRSQHRALCRSLLREQRRLDARLSRAASRAPVSPRRRAWLVLAMLSLVSVGVGVAWATRTTPAATVTTSSSYGPQFQGVDATDGDPATEWLLPDGATGWIEVALDPPRTLTRVRLRNAHNGANDDRATRAYTLEVVSSGEVVAREDGQWEAFDPEPVWYEHAVRAERAERIRVHIHSHHRRGGGLSEIEWD